MKVFSCFTDLDQLTRNPNMVNYTTSADVPIPHEPNSSVYLPVVYPELPNPFPMLNLTLVHLSGQETAESYLVTSDPLIESATFDGGRSARCREEGFGLGLSEEWGNTFVHR